MPRQHSAGRLFCVPVTQDQALAGVAHHHRHARRSPIYRLAVGVRAGNLLVGITTAVRPVARLRNDGLTFEVARVCTDATTNGCSLLCAASTRH